MCVKEFQVKPNIVFQRAGDLDTQIFDLTSSYQMERGFLSNGGRSGERHWDDQIQTGGGKGGKKTNIWIPVGCYDVIWLSRGTAYKTQLAAPQ